MKENNSQGEKPSVRDIIVGMPFIFKLLVPLLMVVIGIVIVQLSGDRLTYIDANIERGVALYEIGNYEQALEYLDRAVSSEDDNADARYHRAAVYAAMENSEAELNDLYRFLVVSESDDARRGKVEERIGELESE